MNRQLFIEFVIYLKKHNVSKNDLNFNSLLCLPDVAIACLMKNDFLSTPKREDFLKLLRNRDFNRSVHICEIINFILDNPSISTEACYMFSRKFLIDDFRFIEIMNIISDKIELDNYDYFYLISDVHFLEKKDVLEILKLINTLSSANLKWISKILSNRDILESRNFNAVLMILIQIFEKINDEDKYDFINNIAINNNVIDSGYYLKILEIINDTPNSRIKYICSIINNDYFLNNSSCINLLKEATIHDIKVPQFSDTIKISTFLDNNWNNDNCIDCIMSLNNINIDVKTKIMKYKNE